MKLLSLQRRTLMLIGIGAVTAALFGVGTVEARFSYKIS